MKIVIALPVYLNWPTGGFHVHYKYADLLSRRGHDVTVVFPRRVEERVSGVESRLKAPLWALRLRLKNRPLVPWFPRDSRVKLRLLRNLGAGLLPRADLLIATSWHTAEALADAPPHCGRKFYIVYDHEYLMTADPTTRQRIERTYRLSFGMVATSSVVAETIRRCGGEPLAQVPCGLDFTEFGTDVPPEQRDRLTLGFPTRTETLKGAADAVEAATLLRARFGDKLRVTTFGSRRVAMPDWIEWVDYPSQRRLRQFYNDQSIFMFPSHFEGWGLPGVEAMACGAALVTAANGGCRDYAFDGETAMVVPSREPKQLADAVGRLIEDDALRLRLARAGEAFVQRFTWEDSIGRLSAVLGA